MGQHGDVVQFGLDWQREPCRGGQRRGPDSGREDDEAGRLAAGLGLHAGHPVPGQHERADRSVRPVLHAVLPGSGHQVTRHDGAVAVAAVLLPGRAADVRGVQPRSERRQRRRVDHLGPRAVRSLHRHVLP